MLSSTSVGATVAYNYDPFGLCRLVRTWCRPRLGAGDRLHVAYPADPEALTPRAAGICLRGT
jgi:hypothetical protein